MKHDTGMILHQIARYRLVRDQALWESDAWDLQMAINEQLQRLSGEQNDAARFEPVCYR